MSEQSTETAQPDVCPTCHVVKPATCRNDQGRKVWPGHWRRSSSPGQS